MRKAALLLIVAVIALGACSKSGKPLSGGTQTATAGPAGGDLVEVTGPADKKPTIKIVSQTPPTSLVSQDVTVGTGAEATAGKQVTVHYVGQLFPTGQEFDASWNRGQTFPFMLGAGQVIQGWDQGVQGMKVGGRRALVIPPSLGYGAQGAGGVIPPNATLIFVVDLLAVS